ncbi:MAG: hypothetical protein ACRDX9_07415 [Acidimicrobiia bacterium]
MTTVATRTLRVGATDYPVVLPSLRDPRLHLASVIITIHVLGQTALGFRVSVPQIVISILVCAVIEMAWTFRQTRQIVWPASAMLTGSGVALILRLVGQNRGDHWTWAGWYIFAGVAAFSLLTKYVIRYRGSHVFNPSNVGLVVAFLVLGSEIIEPLDFWWAPLDLWMTAAYLVILVGGLLITSRLRLLALAAAFWVSLAGGVGVLAASGHCMTTAWALQPVCGSRFWWVIVTSPEVLIFLFFMITDPKTIPQGRLARVAFGVCLAIVCTLLMAPQTTEFGAKVGLLAGLVVLTPLRFLFDRLPSLAPARTDRPAGQFGRGTVLGSLLVLVPMAIVIAGGPARGTTTAAATPDAPDIVIDIAQLPAVTVSADASALNREIDPDQLAVDLAGALAIEAEAMRRADTSLLRSADGGERLVEMERLIEVAATRDEYVVTDHVFDTLHLDVVFTDGPQGGASLGLAAIGTAELVTYDVEGSELGRVSEPFATTFVLGPGSGESWLIMAGIEG